MATNSQKKARLAGLRAELATYLDPQTGQLRNPKLEPRVKAIREEIEKQEEELKVETQEPTLTSEQTLTMPSPSPFADEMTQIAEELIKKHLDEAQRLADD